MNFLDNSGRIFKLKSYNQKPIGYEYNENKYIFWIESNTNYLSINNYYIKTINLLIPIYGDINLNVDDSINIEIMSDSSIFNLVSSKDINEFISNNLKIDDYVNINKDNIHKTLTNDELCVIKISEENNNYILVPIYVIAYSEQEGSLMTNILIHISEKENNLYNLHVDEEWSYITVAGAFNYQYEELVINGENMGISLPKDIIKSIYESSFYNESFNETLYNEKLKELLMNYYGIEMQKGNYNSINNAVKWFGYGNHLSISKLLETDNEFKQQYVHDYFDINNDVIESFKKFKLSSLISLKMLINKETGEEYPFDFNKDIYGENKPVLEDLTEKLIKVKDEKSYLEYYKPYYDYSLNELGLKLSAMKYFLEKYFLPIHISIKSILLTEKVYTNDIKFLNKTNVNVCSPIISTFKIDDEVEFKSDNNIFLSKQVHYVDDNFNEYCDIDNNLDLYYINDTCANIPIKFKSKNKYYDCVLLLEKENLNIEHNKVIINKKININNLNLKIYNTSYEILNNDNLEFLYTFDNINFSYEIKGLNNFIKNLKTLFNKQVEVFKEYINDNYYILFNNEKIYLSNIEQNIYKDNTYIILPAFNGNVYNYFAIIIPDFYLIFKYDLDSIYKIYINNEDISNNIKYNFNNTTDLVYESHFRFYQNDTNKSKYNSFVIYPQLMSKENLTYWVNNKFIIKLLVNNKWYEYKFKLVEPYLDIKLGTLQYKYWDNDNNYLSNFKQLKYIDDNSIIFNSFIRHKQFAEMNNINFIDEYLMYAINNGIKYIDGVYINNDEFYSYIKLNDQKININNYLLGKNITIPKEYLSENNLYLLLYNNYIYILEESGSHDNNYILQDGYIFVDEKDSYNLMLDLTEQIYRDFIYLEYYEENNKKYYRYNYDGVNYLYYPIYEHLNRNTNYLLNRYKENKNISNLDKYNNLMHIYNIYKNEEVLTNILKFNYNFELFNKSKTFTLKYDYLNNNFILNGMLLNNDLYKNDKKESVYVYYKNINPNDDFKYTNNEISIIIDKNKKINLGYAKYLSLNKFKKNEYIPEESSLIYNLNFNEDTITYINSTSKVYNVFYTVKYYKIENNKYIEIELDTDNFLTIYNSINNDNDKTYIIGVEFFTYEYTKQYNEEIIYNGIVDPNNPYIDIEGEHIQLTKKDKYLGNLNDKPESELISIKIENNSNYKFIFKRNNNNIKLKYSIDDNINKINIDDNKILSNSIDIVSGSIIHIYQDFSKNVNYIDDIFSIELCEVKYEETKLKYNVSEYNENKTDITINNYKYYYGDNSSKEVIDLYNSFFKNEIYNIDNDKITLIHDRFNMNTLLDYDLYLMHDYDYWYVIFISQQTLDKSVNSNYDIAPPEIIYEENNEGPYKLKYYKSGKQFLLNRMEFIDKNEYKHFNEDDIIVMSLVNNDMLPVNIDEGSKWTISPISIGNKPSTISTSNADSAIMSQPDLDSKYKKGYYRISVQYSLDKMTQQIYNRETKILIK